MVGRVHGPAIGAVVIVMELVEVVVVVVVDVTVPVLRDVVVLVEFAQPALYDVMVVVLYTVTFDMIEVGAKLVTVVVLV